MTDHAGFVRAAIDLAYTGMNGGHGGPFGAVIVRDGEIVGEGHNRVLSACDPTAHAEVTAIRDAARRAGKFDLSGTTIYVNGLPCPMCMSAIFWARIDRVFYGASAQDAASIGFDDQKFYVELAKPPQERETPAVQVSECVAQAKACYAAWLAREERVHY
jgi:tRNA(Arg) A34 adenosine deaminase TadA